MKNIHIFLQILCYNKYDHFFFLSKKIHLSLKHQVTPRLMFLFIPKQLYLSCIDKLHTENRYRYRFNQDASPRGSAR